MTPSADLAPKPQAIITDAPPSLLTERAKNLALVLLAMTQFVIVIDASIVNVALPSIGARAGLLPATTCRGSSTPTR